MTRRTRVAALVVILGCLVLAGCDYRPRGTFVAEGTTEDLGFRTTNERVGGALFDGTLSVFPPGEPIASTRYTLADMTMEADGTFAGTLLDETDPGNTAFVSWTLHDDDSDGVGEMADLHVETATFIRDVTAPYVEDLDFDAYRCWDEPGRCPAVLGAPTCVYSDTTADSTTVDATFALKDAEGRLPGGTGKMGSITSDGSSGLGSNTPIQGEVCDEQGCRSIELTGTTEGEVHFLREGMPLDPSGVVAFQVQLFTSVFSDASNVVQCPFP